MRLTKGLRNTQRLPKVCLKILQPKVVKVNEMWVILGLVLVAIGLEM